MRALIRAAVGIITSIEVCVMVLFGLSAPFLSGLFSEDPTVVSLAAMTLRAAMLILPCVGTTALVRNVYNAIGMPGSAFTITLVRQLILYIPFLIAFNAVFGYRGLIHAQPAEELLCLFFSVYLLKRSLVRMEKRKNQVQSI